MTFDIFCWRTAIKKVGGKNEERMRSRHHLFHLTKHSNNMIRTRKDLDTTKDIAFLNIEEIQYGRLLGSGGFCNVRSVRAIHLGAATNDSHHHHDYSHDERMNRNNIKFNCKTKNCGYAIKTIRPERLKSERSFLVAVGDLKMEAYLLSRIRHPNIIRLHGITGDGVDVYDTSDRHDAYFLILDRLEESLKDRILRWKLELNRLAQPSVIVGMLNHQRITKRQRQLFLERLIVAHDIASAVEHLHSQRIIYRDLKSNNCGFDKNDKCLLFDFGLARPLPEDMESMSDAYEMSGQAGTTRYMSPEVFRCEPYGLKADVFSFAHLLWEVLSLETPYVHYTKDDYRRRVVKKGVRPIIDDSWPKEIQDLLESAWNADADKRPPMTQVCEILEEVIDTFEVCRSPRRINSSKRTVSPNPQEPCNNSCADSPRPSFSPRWPRFRSHSFV